MKTRESVAAYNKEYSSRPEVIERARVKNAELRHVRSLYKRTKAGKDAERRYRTKPEVRERVRRRNAEVLYGVSYEDLAAWRESKGGVCDICRRKSDLSLNVDHCHSSGKLRGMLCGSCNRGLGMFSDDPARLRAAASYLEENV